VKPDKKKKKKIPLSKSRSYKNKYFKQLVAVRHLHYFSLGVNCFKTLELWIGVPARNFCGSVCKKNGRYIGRPHMLGIIASVSES
jgi:hypothetical protein